jgi:hypothetical protein
MANINSRWKKIIFLGCSHGHLADPKALKTVLKFCSTFKPDLRFHLGDFTDQTAFRSGAPGTKDETVSIADDLAHGLNFLREFQPTHLINGNHEDRLWRLADHHNEIIARAATSVIREIKDYVEENDIEYVETYDINSSWIEVGDYKAIHGWMFNENALRDHCEHFGNIVMAHLHIASVVPGRRSDHPRGFCTGTLTNVPAMAYARTRRATARWSHGFVFGETNGKTTHLQLCAGPHNQPGDWRLPV